MNIEKLIHWLESHHIEPIEDRKFPDGRRAITFYGKLPFPIHERQHAWYTLVLDQDETEVDTAIIEAILRRFWHLELEIPKDDDQPS
jgi:hypothetical protein